MIFSSGLALILSQKPGKFPVPDFDQDRKEYFPPPSFCILRFFLFTIHPGQIENAI
jgi:hypothetical protein